MPLKFLLLWVANVFHIILSLVEFLVRSHIHLNLTLPFSWLRLLSSMILKITTKNTVGAIHKNLLSITIVVGG